MNTTTHNVALVASSTTTSDKSEDVKKVAVISDDHADRILQAYRMLHGVVSSLPGKDPLPTFGHCGKDEWETILTRSFKALNSHIAAKKEEATRGVRIACKHVVDTYMVEARKEKAEYDTVVANCTPKMRAIIPPFPTDVMIPVLEFSAHLGQGLTMEQVVNNLSNLSYKLVKGKEKGEYFVKVPFVATLAT